MHRILILLLLASGIFNNMYAQDTLIQHQHKKNIFTLAFYKQPGQDSLVDFIDGANRILKINKLNYSL